MGVSTETCIKFYTKEKQFVKKYNMDDRSDDYIYDGLVSDGGTNFNPDNFGEFSDDEKKIMKVYFDEQSSSVAEGYAKVTSNIQSPTELLPIWIKIRTSVISPFQSGLNDYHNGIINYHKKMTESIEIQKKSKRGLFAKKEDLLFPELSELKSEYDFKDILWRVIWKIDSISKIIALLITAKENDMLVEITVADY